MIIIKVIIAVQVHCLLQVPELSSLSSLEANAVVCEIGFSSPQVCTQKKYGIAIAMLLYSHRLRLL